MQSRQAVLEFATCQQYQPFVKKPCFNHSKGTVTPAMILQQHRCVTYPMQVYESIALPIIQPVMNGISGTIFAYGVTSSGKTHTMMGTATDPGLVPRSIKTIFDFINTQPDRCVGS
jgi:hypothetical protein